MLINFLVAVTLTFIAISTGYERRFEKLLNALALVLVVWIVVTAVAYLFVPTFFYSTEVALASIASAWSHGSPIYTELNDSNRYSLLYGPLTFMIPGFMVALSGNSIFATKVPSTILFGVTLIVLYQTYRTQLGKAKEAFIATAWVLGLIGVFFNFFYSMRPDSYLFCATALSLAVAVSQLSTAWKMFFIGGLMGFASGAKIHGAFYLLPSFFLVWPYKNIRASVLWAALAGVAFLTVFFLPFTVSGVSFFHYVLWLKMASRHGYAWKAFTASLAYIAPLVTVMSCFCFKEAEQRKRVWILAGTTMIILFFASKTGAGANHFLPLAPYFVFYFFLYCKPESLRPFAQGRYSLLRLALMATVLYAGVIHQKSVRKILFQAKRHWAEYDQVNELTSKYSDGANMFVFNDEPFHYKSYYAPRAVDRGGRLLIEPVSVMDHRISGLNIPSSTFAALKDCEIKYIFVAKAGKIFGLLHPHDQSPIYPQAIVDVFYSQYSLIDETEDYQVYTCLNRQHPQDRSQF